MATSSRRSASASLALSISLLGSIFGEYLVGLLDLEVSLEVSEIEIGAVVENNLGVNSAVRRGIRMYFRI